MVTVKSLEPAPDSSDHHYRRPLNLRFTGDASDSVFRVRGPGQDGLTEELTLMPAEWSEAGTVASVQPVAFLAPDTRYQVMIERDDSMFSYEFTTSSVGTPVAADVELSGLTYDVRIHGENVASPAGLAPHLDSLSADFAWLWQFHAGSDDAELRLETGAGLQGPEELSQDSCTPTASLFDADNALELTGSLFAAEASRAVLWLGAHPVVLQEVLVDGDFHSDATAISEVAISGWLEVGGLAPLLGAPLVADGGSKAPCDWVQAMLGASCESCPAGSEQCLWFALESLDGSLLDQALESVATNAPQLCDGSDAFTSSLSCALASGRPAAAGLWWCVGLAIWLGRRRQPC